MVPWEERERDLKAVRADGERRRRVVGGSRVGGPGGREERDISREATSTLLLQHNSRMNALIL